MRDPDRLSEQHDDNAWLMVARSEWKVEFAGSHGEC